MVSLVYIGQEIKGENCAFITKTVWLLKKKSKKTWLFLARERFFQFRSIGIGQGRSMINQKNRYNTDKQNESESFSITRSRMCPCW